MQSIPQELLISIFHLLHSTELKKLLRVCKLWNVLALNAMDIKINHAMKRVKLLEMVGNFDNNDLRIVTSSQFKFQKVVNYQLVFENSNLSAFGIIVNAKFVGITVPYPCSCIPYCDDVKPYLRLLCDGREIRVCEMESIGGHYKKTFEGGWVEYKIEDRIRHDVGGEGSVSDMFEHEQSRVVGKLLNLVIEPELLISKYIL